MLINPYLDYFKAAKGKSRSDDFDNFTDYRREAVRQFAFPVPDEKGLRLIASHAPKIVEIGAGTGYWAYMLSQVGVDIVAYDIEPYKNHRFDAKWFEIQLGDYTKVKQHSDRALFLSWPPCNDMAYDTLRIYRGDTVIYIGEWNRGVTAEEKFHALLEKKFDEIEVYEIPCWENLIDCLYIYKRKSR